MKILPKPTKPPKLKPCPFCGGTDIQPGDAYGIVFMCCYGCSASVEAEDHIEGARQKAIKLWNTRTIAKEPTE